MKQVDILIIGGGCAGMASALAAKEQGVDDILIVERSPYLGGILRQCIHNGFGVHRFRKDMTGTEYAQQYIDRIHESGIPYSTNSFVIHVSGQRVATVVDPVGGLTQIQAGAIVFAMGCRERPRGALMIPGTRPAGVFTAGTAQRYMNIEGYLVGRKIVILGSGDIGLIMARQFVVEGAQVLAVAEIMPHSSGLTRNIVQCLEDFSIPIYYNTTIVNVLGRERVEKVVLAKVDENHRPIAGTETELACDTLILSVGLIPENELAGDADVELSKSTGGAVVDDLNQTSVPGIFSCGNVLHVHDLVDFVSLEAEETGKNAALYVKKLLDASGEYYRITEGPGVTALVPHRIRSTGGGAIRFQFRPRKRVQNCEIMVSSGGAVIKTLHKKILTPGEMCEVSVDRAAIAGTVCIEVADHE